MARSIFIGLTTAFICLLIAYPYAYFLANKNNKNLKIIGIALIVAPLFIFTLAKVLAIRGMFSFIFSKANAINSLNSNWFMILGLVYLNLPMAIVPIYGVFQTMPKSLTEASNDLGYNHFQTFFKVVLPYSLKAMFSVLALVFLLASTTLIISNKLLLNGSQHKMIGGLIVLHSSPGNKFELARVSSLALITIVTMLSIYGLIFGFPKLVRKIKETKNG
jgi:spermidine/putrescine transport system permease protein